MKIKLRDFIRDIPDFPKPGILFKDITPLLDSAEATNFAIQQLLKQINKKKVVLS